VTVAWRREEIADGHPAIVLTLHVQPGSRRTEAAGRHGELPRIRVAAPPVDGKANAELLHFLARAFGVPLRNVTLVRGEASRRKVVRIVGPSARPDLGWE
jgi:uncharacterized protein (TIGR00251 family)